jgi:hypothetical protein
MGKGDTTKTINNLKAGHVHVGITYHKVAEQIAIDTGSAKGCMYEDDSKHPCVTDCKNATESHATRFVTTFTWLDLGRILQMLRKMIIS